MSTTDKTNRTDPPHAGRVQPQRGPGHVSQRGDDDAVLLVRADGGEAAAAVPGPPGARQEDRALAHQRRLHHVQRGPPRQVLVQEARMRLKCWKMSTVLVVDFFGVCFQRSCVFSIFVVFLC